MAQHEMESEHHIAVGCDHGGLGLKRELVPELTRWGWTVEDVGCHTEESVDYPDFAATVSRMVAEREVELGLLICGTGIGMCIAANKVPGVRAALCGDTYSAQMTRRHNDANVLCLGGRVIGAELAKAVLAAFLEGDFEGGRHQRRLEKIARLETLHERPESAEEQLKRLLPEPLEPVSQGRG
jgi:ribose 5-phosphate isomerase B